MINYLEKSFKQNEKGLKYILTAPTDYKKGESLPLIVFLHGAGERGDDLELVKTHGIPKYFSKNQDHLGIRAITLSPQCPSERTWYDYKWEVISLIDEVAREYNVSDDSIALTGISMGGFGTWEIALQVPEKFSAIAPICGGGMEWRAWYLRNLPIRTFHGALDDVVPFAHTEMMVNAIRAQGGNVEFTVYDDLGHCCWDRAYEQTDIISWLASARKK
ncbi:MAG: prolyl oligopeptidase family serine peptidase [Clostridia bacterium]|nr:prolyl oligopeptidase family serine peptidase [Clostridia bacterium]